MEACCCCSRELAGWGRVLPTRLQSGGSQALEISKQLSVAGFVTLEHTQEMKGPKQRGSLPSLVRILEAEQAIFRGGTGQGPWENGAVWLDGD